MNYLKKIDEIVYLLKEADENILIDQIANAKLMGGTGGEILSIICSLLKTYEIQRSSSFEPIKKQAHELFNYALSLGIHTKANFQLLEDLKNK